MGKRITIDINETIRNFLGRFEVLYAKYTKNFNYQLELDKVKSTYHPDYFDFNSREEYNKFKYELFPFELYGRAEPTSQFLAGVFNDWLNGALRNFDEGEEPTVTIMAPLEAELTIPSTLSFLASNGFKCRNVIFPIDSTKVWEYTDVLITADPKYLKDKPEDKDIIIITAPYNTDVEVEHRKETLIELLKDHNNFLLPILEK